MALINQVQAALAGLVSPTQAPQQLSVQDADKSFRCQLAGLDSLGCAFTEFKFTIGKLSAAPIDQLKRVAETLSVRLTYLLEPIHPIELTGTMRGANAVVTASKRRQWHQLLRIAGGPRRHSQPEPLYATGRSGRAASRSAPKSRAVSCAWFATLPR